MELLCQTMSLVIVFYIISEPDGLFAYASTSLFSESMNLYKAVVVCAGCEKRGP